MITNLLSDSLPHSYSFHHQHPKYPEHASFPATLTDKQYKQCVYGYHSIKVIISEVTLRCDYIYGFCQINVYMCKRENVLNVVLYIY